MHCLRRFYLVVGGLRGVRDGVERAANLSVRVTTSTLLSPVELTGQLKER